MTIELNDTLTEKEMEALLEKIDPAPRLFDAKKYFNKIAIEEDPMKVQQEVRGETC